jgi:hypothetical protein
MIQIIHIRDNTDFVVTQKGWNYVVNYHYFAYLYVGDDGSRSEWNKTVVHEAMARLEALDHPIR